jgi:hypothetical protein
VAVVVVAAVAAVWALGGDDASVRTTGSDATSSTSAGAGPGSTATTGVPTTTVPTTAGSTTLGTTSGAEVTTTTPPGRPGARVQVRFVGGSGVRLRDGSLVSEAGVDLTALQDVLARQGVIAIDRLFQRPEADLDAERAAAEARTGLPQPDLNLYYRLTLPEGVDAGGLIADLGGLTVVERAYLDPVAAPPP